MRDCLQNTDKNRSKSDQNGLSLIELMVVISLLAAVILYLNPSKWINLFDRSFDRTKLSQGTRSFGLKLERIAEKNAHILQANLHDMVIANDEGQYAIYVDGFPSSQAPYIAMIQKDADAAVIFAEDIAELSSPNRPGFEIFYFGQSGEQTTVTTDIKQVKVSVQFEQEGAPLKAVSSFNIVSNNVEIESR